jgi:hypothetical protein
MQILLDDARLERLRERATAEGSSVGALVRAAIDRELEARSDAVVVAAVESFLAAPPFPVGEPDELDREIDEMYDRRFR